MIGPGTLPSVGKSQIDLVGYRFSGITPLTGEQLLGAMPEIAAIADVAVDPANPWQIATDDDLRKLALQIEEVLRFPQTDGVVLVQGSNTLKRPLTFYDCPHRQADRCDRRAAPVQRPERGRPDQPTRQPLRRLRSGNPRQGRRSDGERRDQCGA